MLQNMREGAGKWLIWVIIIVVILALGLWGISYYFMAGGASTPPVAKVNGVNITQQQFMDAYNRLRQTEPNLFAAPDAANAIRQELLASLINQEILSQAATDDGFAVSQLQINAFLNQVPAFQDNGRFSPLLFNAALNRLMFTPAEFMDSLQQSMLISQVRNGIVASSFVLPNEAKQFIQLFNQQRDIGYLIVPAQRFLAQATVSASNIENYYQQHVNDYQTPEQISIAYLEITPQSVTANIKPSTDQLMSYYQNNISNYTTPARWHVAHILLNVPQNASLTQIAELKQKLATVKQQAQQGTSFASLAKQYSQDIVTANSGGEMPWFTAGSLGSVFESTVATLTPGQISDPVQTQYGVEIIKLLAVEKQTVKPFKAVAEQIKQAYISEQVHKQLADMNDTLANLTFENPNSLDSAAKELKLTVQTTPLFTRQGLTSGLAATPSIVSTAFSDDVLQQGNNSDVITLSDGSLLVLRINKHIPAAEIPLNQVSNKINDMLKQQQAEKAAATFAQQLMPQMTSSETAVQVAIKNQLEWVSKPNISRASKNIDPQILQQVFNTSAPGDKQLSLSGFALANGDYAIVGVSKMTLPSYDAISLDQRKALQQQLQTLFASTEYADYVAAATKKAKVKQTAAEQIGN